MYHYSTCYHWPYEHTPIPLQKGRKGNTTLNPYRAFPTLTRRMRDHLLMLGLVMLLSHLPKSYPTQSRHWAYAANLLLCKIPFFNHVTAKKRLPILWFMPQLIFLGPFQYTQSNSSFSNPMYDDKFKSLCLTWFTWYQQAGLRFCILRISAKLDATQSLVVSGSDFSMKVFTGIEIRWIRGFVLSLWTP